MKKVAIKIYDNSKNTTTHELVSNSNHPTIIVATDTAHYELIDLNHGVAPDHIITKRDGNNLVVIFDNTEDLSDLIIEDFYDYTDSSLVGKSESGDYYYYTPDTGEVSDYVTLLEPYKDISGHALGGKHINNPWWVATTEPETITTINTDTRSHSDVSIDINAVSSDEDFLNSVSEWEYLPWVFVGSFFAATTYIALDDDKESKEAAKQTTSDSEATDTSTIEFTVPDGETIAIGNALDNVMQGNQLDNTLNGKDGNDTLVGGAGNDTLIGGNGKDIFKFSDALDGSVDTISDFVVGEDTIQLNKSVFTALNIDKSNLMDHIDYDKTTGKLSYDSDGSGSVATVHFSTLSTDLALSADSFTVI